MEKAQFLGFELYYKKTSAVTQVVIEEIAPIEFTTKVKVLVVEDIALNRLLMKDNSR